MLSKNLALTEVLKKLKSNSSKLVKTKGLDYKDFNWQNGYGAFSINPTEVDVVVKYIENQHEHHRTTSYKEEYIAFLKKYNIDYKDEYIWD